MADRVDLKGKTVRIVYESINLNTGTGGLADAALATDVVEHTGEEAGITFAATQGETCTELIPKGSSNPYDTAGARFRTLYCINQQAAAIQYVDIHYSPRATFVTTGDADSSFLDIVAQSLDSIVVQRSGATKTFTLAELAIVLHYDTRADAARIHHHYQQTLLA